MLFLWQPLWYYVLPFFFLAFAVFLLKRLSTSPKPRKRPPPSPPKLPIIGNLHQLGSFPHRSLRSLARKYGALMQLHLGGIPVVVVSSADAAHEIMKTHDLVFSDRPKSTVASKLLYNYRDVAFAPYGEYWRQMRSICVVQLLSNKRVSSFRGVREEETSLMIETIKGCCSSSSSPAAVNLSAAFVTLTNDVACRVALGRKYGGGKFKRLLGEFVELLGGLDVGDYLPWLAWVNRVNGTCGRVDKVAKELDSFEENVVDEHMNSPERDQGQQDFVDALLQVQRDGMASFPIHKDSIKALILDVFAAGTDTTYAAMEWAVAELLRHPKALKELQNEVRKIGRGKRGISEDDLEGMHYLKAVMKETLRLHPPVPLLVPRRTTQPVKVMGHDIAAGTTVITNAWAIGRDPSRWEEAEEFRPERFLNSSVDFRGHHLELIPFGAGRRGCPGTQFAVAIDELALANLVNSFNLSLPGGDGEDLDMGEVAGLTIHRKSPLLAVVTPLH